MTSSERIARLRELGANVRLGREGETLIRVGGPKSEDEPKALCPLCGGELDQDGTCIDCLGEGPQDD